MKARCVVALLKKDLKVFIREPAALFLLLIFPLVVSVTFGIAFGGIDSGGGDIEFRFGVVNMDSTTEIPWSVHFLENLTELNGTLVEQYESNETGQVDLLNGNLHALIVIPDGFGDSIDSYWANPLDGSSWENTTLDLYVDSGSMMASSAVPPIVQQTLLNTIYGEDVGTLELPIDIGNPAFIEANNLNTWDFMAPGIFAFASIFMIMMVSQSLTVERDGGLLKRMSTTPVSSSEFILSKTLAYMILGIMQVLLVFLGSFAIGYRPATDVSGIAFAILIVVVFTLVSTGFGMITAVLSKSADVATGIGFIFIMPQMFFGTFMQLGSLSETIGTYMPSNYVTHAITTLFLRGAPISTPSIWIDLLIVLTIGVMLLGIGTLLFRRQVRR